MVLASILSSRNSAFPNFSMASEMSWSSMQSILGNWTEPSSTLGCSKHHFLAVFKSLIKRFCKHKHAWKHKAHEDKGVNIVINNSKKKPTIITCINIQKTKHWSNYCFVASPLKKIMPLVVIQVVDSPTRDIERNMMCTVVSQGFQKQILIGTSKMRTQDWRNQIYI